MEKYVNMDKAQEKKFDKRRTDLKWMSDVCTTAVCRRKTILEYFGELNIDCNKGCDVCTNPTIVKNSIIALQSANTRFGGFSLAGKIYQAPKKDDEEHYLHSVADDLEEEYEFTGRQKYNTKEEQWADEAMSVSQTKELKRQKQEESAALAAVVALKKKRTDDDDDDPLAVLSRLEEAEARFNQKRKPNGVKPFVAPRKVVQTPPKKTTTPAPTSSGLGWSSAKSLMSTTPKVETLTTKTVPTSSSWVNQISIPKAKAPTPTPAPTAKASTLFETVDLEQEIVFETQPALPKVKTLTPIIVKETTTLTPKITTKRRNSKSPEGPANNSQILDFFKPK
jgi:superfamily II DNA helicase RecQ